MDSQSSKVYVGVDVSKARLDVAIGKDGAYWQISNDREGIRKCVEQLKVIQPTLIVIESTGGLERPLLTELYAAGMPFALVHPGRVRDFAKSIGLLGKTDKLDARLLARFGEAVQPPATRLASEDEQRLQVLMLRRRQLLDLQVNEGNHLMSMPLYMRPKIEGLIQILKDDIEEINQQIAELIQKIPDFREKEAILRSAKGVGPVTCAILLSNLPELGTLSRKKIAALVGLAPYNNDSGYRRGKRRIKGGRADVREVLYMSAVSAARYNPLIMPFYQTLLKQGKVKKVALIACARKLLTILNAMVRDMQPFRMPALPA